LLLENPIEDFANHKLFRAFVRERENSRFLTTNHEPMRCWSLQEHRRTWAFLARWAF